MQATKVLLVLLFLSAWPILADPPEKAPRVLSLLTAGPKAPEVPERIVIPRGGAPTVWLHVRGNGKDLLCRDNQLKTCPSLHFLVEGPGLEKTIKVYFEGSPRMANPKREESPLDLRPFKGDAYEKIVLLPGGQGILDVFGKSGTYKVVAAAGDLRSNAITVFVDKSLPRRETAKPKRNGPAEARWVKGENSLARETNGKSIWQTRIQEGIQNVKDEKNVWVVTSVSGKQYGIDPGTGKLLWMK